MSGSGRFALPDVWEWSEDPPGCPEVVWRSSRMSLSGERPFWMYGSYREAPGCLGRPLGCPGVIGRPPRLSGSGWVAIPDIWESSGDPPGCPGVLESPSRMSLSG